MGELGSEGLLISGALKLSLSFSLFLLRIGLKIYLIYLVPFYPSKFAVPSVILFVDGYFPPLKGIKFSFSTLDK